jgi:hypothetical protein
MRTESLRTLERSPSEKKNGVPKRVHESGIPEEATDKYMEVPAADEYERSS